MRRLCIACILSVATLAIVPLALKPGIAQAQQLPGLKPPPAAPVKPYTAVAVKPPGTFSDPSFEAFRKTLADVAKRKDRAALAKLVVAQGFFWVQDKDLADKRKPGIDNLAKAIDLDAQDGAGWETVAGYAEEPTAAELPDHKGVICSPADPTLDPKAFDSLLQSTQTDATDWGYPSKDGVEVHAAAQADSPVVDKLGLYLVHVLPDSAPPSNGNAVVLLHVALPSGKTGFVVTDALVPLGGDQMCYTKDAGGWKIAGYFGGASP